MYRLSVRPFCHCSLIFFRQQRAQHKYYFLNNSQAMTRVVKLLVGIHQSSATVLTRNCKLDVKLAVARRAARLGLRVVSGLRLRLWHSSWQCGLCHCESFKLAVSESKSLRLRLGPARLPGASASASASFKFTRQDSPKVLLPMLVVLEPLLVVLALCCMESSSGRLVSGPVVPEWVLLGASESECNLLGLIATRKGTSGLH